MVSNAGAKAQETEAEKAERIRREVDSLENSMPLVNPETGEVIKVEKNAGLSDDQLRALDSLEGLQQALGIPIAQSTDLGTGFAVLDKEGKRRLVGVPLLFVFWQFNNGDQGVFVSTHVVQVDMMGKLVGKYIINDGSTGICQQLRDYTEHTQSFKGLFAPKGLRASDYDFTDEQGNTSKATTFYIDTSPAA